ncbi:transcription elongation regulator [Coemansia furcata]|uniref:Transcription elongation regulator n=1 Tax=Coemansia furcata TaxID=417177 RepID=A0ACC1LP80_9FUNG|nr:transcription elongation regulator [Coemansia furcata]
MANDHDWALFLAPTTTPGSRHVPNEPYYFERNNEITTWVRPFDYIESPLSIGEAWQQEQTQHRLDQARAHAKADRPLSQTRINDEWTRVATVQGREYFYNTRTKASQWDQPEELEGLLEEENVDQAMEGTEMTADDVEWMLAQMDEDQEDEEEMEVREQNTGDHVAMSVDDLPKDERITMFKTMLREVGVNAFGTWETQIKNYESDPRFALVDAAERRELFDTVCKERAAKPLPSQRNDMHPFDELLAEKVTKKKTSFAKFCQKNLKDARFTSLKTSREREKRFDKHLETIS